MEDKKCPICGKDLTLFSTCKDIEGSDGDNEIVIGRLNVMGCADCDYIDESNMWFD